MAAGFDNYDQVRCVAGHRLLCDFDMSINWQVMSGESYTAAKMGNGTLSMLFSPIACVPCSDKARACMQIHSCLHCMTLISPSK